MIKEIFYKFKGKFDPCLVANVIVALVSSICQVFFPTILSVKQRSLSNVSRDKNVISNGLRGTQVPGASTGYLKKW